MKVKMWLFAVTVLFTAYFFLAARHIPGQMVLVPRWLNSLESEDPVRLGGGAGNTETAPGLSFSLGGRFGFVGQDGHFSVNRMTKANISLSGRHWAEYEMEPDRITIHDSAGEVYAVIEKPRGYPFFLDGRIFLIGSEQNSVSEIDVSGGVSWTYEFASQLTCVDAANGLLLAGSLDGLIVVIDKTGRKVFSFEPGGSRYPVILGCAVSGDGSRIALVSGIDKQRFLFLERFGGSAGDYKVVYHEFLDDGFRRPVYVTFVENDRWAVFERVGGLGFYEAGSRQAAKVKLDGEIRAVDQSGGQGLVFAITSRSGNTKELVCVRLPDRVMLTAPFKSEDVFLGRVDSRLLIGGGQTIIAFELEKR